jgi:uncharacterized protein (TIGR03437 family)
MLVRSVSLFFYLGLAFAAAAPSFPVLTYANYLRDSFSPTAIAIDKAGNIYLAGNAIVDPTTQQTAMLVVKLNPQANQYLYSRYVGGSAMDTASAIAVDNAGNAYVAGVTTSPDFPVTANGNLATPPVPGSTERSFVFKLDPNGQLVFSDIFGGSANSFALAVAVNAAGQVLVSGTSESSNFPTTPGVFSVADANGAPYLIELDPTGTKIIFSATGIGGNSLTFDSAGNIYMAGTTGSLTYPLTPNTYQPTFPVFMTCIAPCGGEFQGPNQYVTKLDPTGTKMIFSTAVSGSGNTMNEGLAVDAAGNVYLTGLAGASYPYTVTPPVAPLAPAADNLATPAVPFLSKLDPAGQKLLYSIPVGGMGVQVDSNGNAYVGGILGLFHLYDVDATLPALANLPAGCSLQTPGISAYVSQVDPSGNVLASQFMGGSTLTITGVALSGTTLWTTGPTYHADFPFSPNAVSNSFIRPSTQLGAFLGAVDFSGAQPPAGTPQLGCILDAADLAPAGPIVPYQLLTIFGNGLGPATPVSATDNATISLGGVTVTFGSVPAPLLYVSSTQINFAVPLVSEDASTVMQVTVNGVSSAPLQFPVTSANPSLFLVSGTYQANLGLTTAVALNADGSQNSPTNPAKLGSVISVFVNGLSIDPDIPYEPPDLYSPGAITVINYHQATPFVLQVNLQLPTSSMSFECQVPNTTACLAGFTIFDLFSYLTSANLASTGGLGFGGLVWVAP